MRESKNSSQSWRVRLNFIARLRNKFNKNVDKYFVNHYFPEQAATAPAPAPAPAPATSPAPSVQVWSTPHSQFEYNEASSSNHTSAPNSQYFDAVDPSEYIQQHQRFEFPLLDVQGQNSSQPGMIPPSGDFHQNSGTFNMGPQLDQDYGMQISHPPPTSHHQSFLGDFDDRHHQQVPVLSVYDMGFSDAVMEMQQDEPMSPWQANSNYVSQEYGAPSMSMQMSGDTVETMDSNMMDTGDSNFTGYVLPPHPVQQRRTVITNILTFEEMKHILFEEEAESRLPGRRGFRVVASIVYAYRRLRGLVRRKRMQRCTPSSPSGEGSGSSKLKRIKSADCSRVYQGVKQRKGKWVAEIRVSRMPDKVWLGSFLSEKQAALAYDAGLHHCSMKRTKIFNFKESPQRLGPSQYVGLLAMSKEDRKTTVQTLAADYAMAYGSSNNNIR
ncbi:hypothetical protein KC19_5G028200 [Ceratodon purpureus]|uniref:AP2/ERF domain-containing protein n=1 Tax=Ceratodon purpureus TaxID=3225 RepID=A0A8T0HZA4_CERPU|nr:hypothetical protein KC19_5G028200 [Ceratodon purpureus]